MTERRNRAKVIYNAKAVLPGRILKDAAIVVEDGIITSISRARNGLRRIPHGAVINAAGHYVSPGFIDTHIHGLPAEIFEKEKRFGTTAILPAVSCSSYASVKAAIKKIGRFIEEDSLGPNVLGVRLEGPFISPEKAGAQDKRYIVEPGVNKLREIIGLCSGRLKIMTIAPERKGAQALLKVLRKNRVLASIGHSNATYAEALGGIRAGVSHATHMFNAMSGLDSRSSGVIGAVLENDEVTAEAILDLVHITGALFRTLIKKKGIDRVILITDSIEHGLPGGVARRKGAYRFKSGRIAGSYLTMNRAVGNACKAAGLSVPEAVRLATLNPARLLGLEKRKGSLGAGKDADIVIFDKFFNVKLTIINGDIIYRARGI